MITILKKDENWTEITKDGVSLLVPNGNIYFEQDLSGKDPQIVKIFIKDFNGALQKSYYEPIDEILGEGGLAYFPNGGSIAGLEPVPTQFDVFQNVYPILSVNFNKSKLVTTIAAPVTANSYTFTVANATGIAIGDGVVVSYSPFFWMDFGLVTNVAGNVITVDTPLTSPYFVGSDVEFSSIDMNVDGSVTPQLFRLRGENITVPVVADITALSIIMTTDTAPELTDFGDIAGGLASGLLIQRKITEPVQTMSNYFNCRNNRDLLHLSEGGGDLKRSFSFTAKDGVVITVDFKKTFGSIVKLLPDEDLIITVKDNLASLDSLRVMAHGNLRFGE